LGDLSDLQRVGQRLTIRVGIDSHEHRLRKRAVLSREIIPIGGICSMIATTMRGRIWGPWSDAGIRLTAACEQQAG
jgi:hypothetical protein